MAKRLIYLEYIKSSVTVKEYFEKLEDEKALTKEKMNEVADLIGATVAKMHYNNMVHGDLTTSNFLLVKNEEKGQHDIIVIDFGLSHLEATDEDKGVDLYLLERALASSNINSSEFFDDVIKKYTATSKPYQNINKVLNKFQEVRARGRKRSMIG